MRGIFGLVGLLVTLAVVGVLVKKQLGAAASVPVAPSSAAGLALPAGTPGASVQQQSAAIGQQVKQSVEAAMQPARREGATPAAPD